MTNILITDSSQRSSLAITRSLGKFQSFNIVNAYQKGSQSLSSKSKYSKKSYIFSSSITEHPLKYLDELVKYASNNDINYIFPTTDLSLEVLLSNSEYIEKESRAKLIAPDPACYFKASDKNQLFKIAQSLNIPVPQSHFYSNATEVNTSQLDIPFPLVIKPYKSVIYHDDRIILSSVNIAYNIDELQSILTSAEYLQKFPFTIQEFIPGKGAGIFSFFHNGQSKGFFSHRRLREKPPGGGVSVLSESILPPADLQHYSSLLLEHLNWSGMAMVEYRISPKGQPYLMEINGRPWGSIQLAIDSGFNFPYMAYLAASGDTVNPVDHYKTGQRLRWLLGDLDRLYLVWKDDPSLKTKLLETLKFLNFFGPRLNFEVNRINDIQPALQEFKNYLHSLR